MNELTTINIHEAINHLKKKDFSVLELIGAHFKRIEETKHLNAFITSNYDKAMDSAKKSDSIIRENKMRNLEGIPIAVKDNFCTKNIRTTASSKILHNFVPQYESTVTRNMLNEGCIITGKTSLDEFGMGSSNKTSFFGKVKNPVGKNKMEYHVPGGSSGGSAVAVSSFSSMGALGTDTGGSIRQPAAFCGVVGLKPTYGRCSRFGIMAFASSLDQAGSLTRTVEDASIMLRTMASYDKKDSTSSRNSLENLLLPISEDISKLNIGIPTEYMKENIASDIFNSWEMSAKWLKEGGANLVEIDLPHSKYSLSTYYIISSAEASSNLSRYDGIRFGYRSNDNNIKDLYVNSRSDGFGEEVKRRIMIGTYVLSKGHYDSYYLHALKVRQLIKQDFINAFKKVDAIILPTTPYPAPPLNKNTDNPIEMYMNDIFTVPASLAGIPAISLPVGLTKDGRPTSIQVMGPSFKENTILKVGKFIETAANFSKIKNQEKML